MTTKINDYLFDKKFGRFVIISTALIDGKFITRPVFAEMDKFTDRWEGANVIAESNTEDEALSNHKAAVIYFKNLMEQ